jgi:hypothetical protein
MEDERGTDGEQLSYSIDSVSTGGNATVAVLPDTFIFFTIKHRVFQLPPYLIRGHSGLSSAIRRPCLCRRRFLQQSPELSQNQASEPTNSRRLFSVAVNFLEFLYPDETLCSLERTLN